MKPLNAFIFALTATAICSISCHIIRKPATTVIEHNKPEASVDAPSVLVAQIGNTSADEPAVVSSERNSGLTFLSATQTTALLKQAQLAPLITSENKDYGTNIYNGFTGKDNYRIEFYLGKITADANDPSTFTVEGKTRYKKQVVEIKGHVHIDSLFANYQKDEDNFQAKATFEFEETKDGGKYKGVMYIDFAKSRDGEKYHLIYNKDATMGAQVLMQGNYTSSTGNVRNVIAGRNVMAFANDILDNFYYGGRTRTISTKYRSLGWDDYWQHAEWWANSNSL